MPASTMSRPAVVTESGKTIWTMVSAAPLPGGGTVVATVDMTEQRRSREEQEKLRTQLVTSAENRGYRRSQPAALPTISTTCRAMTIHLNGMQAQSEKTAARLS